MRKDLQGGILVALMDEGKFGLTPKELAKIIGTSKGAIYSAAMILGKKGYIQKNLGRYVLSYDGEQYIKENQSKLLEARESVKEIVVEVPAPVVEEVKPETVEPVEPNKEYIKTLEERFDKQLERYHQLAMAIATRGERYEDSKS